MSTPSSAGPEQVSDAHMESEQNPDLYSSPGVETPRAEDDGSSGVVVERHGDSEEAAESYGNGSVTTPTRYNFSAPPSLTSSPMVQQPHRTVSAGDDSYFAPRPMHYHSAHLSIPEDEVLSVSPSRHLTTHSPSNLKSLRANTALTPEHALASASGTHERPIVQRDYSTASSISNASTIRASDMNTYLPLSQSRSRESYYPNQAFSALQSQYHPTPPSPYFLRSRRSNPSPHTTYTAHSQSPGSPGMDDTRSATQSTARTSSSAASSPGLFTPRGQVPRPAIHQSETTDGTYATPYLHHTHRQIPKETHLAEIEFDPISGRKVINQYEIIDELGRGVHGKVKLGRNLTNGKFVAIKIVERYSKRKRLGKNNSHEAKIKKEIAILKKARHPNIVGLLEVIDDPQSKKVYIILEHVEMGEIAWRTDGAAEICFIEYRRYKREVAGEAESEAAQLEDERILEEASKHIDRQDKRAWQKLKQSRLKSGDIPTWSLEHGDDEDDAYSNGNISRIPSATTSLSHTARLPYQENFPPRPDQTVIHHEDTSVAPQQRKDSDSQLSQHSHSDHASWTGLEGTMYGAYDAESIRGRTPSVAGSLSSTGYEHDLTQQIPENFRHVPLMTIPEARRAFRDTVLGLEYLHFQSVVHRDIKPANLLQAASGHIKISDFGVSYLGKEKTEPFSNSDEASEYEGQDNDEAVELAKTVGTPAFYAPELCVTDPEVETPPVTAQIDIWALGVTLYCLIFGRVPFYDENTFYLMRIIADDEVVIPKQRLRAVDSHTNSRPSSHNRALAAPASQKRLPHELVYEDVDDELRDILKRMLTKDPRKRIKLNEIKHHGWVVRDIQDKVRWLDETDPDHSGARIQISEEDVDVAVVPLVGFVERAKSTIRKFGEVIGLASKKPSNSRKRAESVATNVSDRSNPASVASSSSTISQDARRLDIRRSSVRPSDEILGRFVEHPLSQSVTASPEPRDNLEFFPGPDSAPDSPMSTVSQSGQSKTRLQSLRPMGPERVHTSVSGTGSIRTIRPGDLGLGTGATTLPALPSTPLDMSTPSGLGGIFGGAKQKVLSTVRNARDHSLGRHGRASPIDRVATASTDGHSQASQAVSEVMAAGQVTASAHMIEDSTTASSVTSAVSSRAGSLSSNTHLEAGLKPEDHLSRDSSFASMTSPRRGRARTDTSSGRPHSAFLPLLGDATAEWSQSRPSSSSTKENATLDFTRAKGEQIRRRIQESQQRPVLAAAQGKRQPVVGNDCPPSPDDMMAWDKQDEAEQVRHQEDSYFSTVESLPEPAYAHLVPSSSDDHFTGMSQSTSNPSIPSVASADSSVRTDESAYFSEHAHGPRKESEGEELFISVDQRAAYAEASSTEDFAYDGDHAIESDDDTDSDDSFVEMTRHKSKRVGLTRSESISNGELALHRERRATNENQSIKSARSGSNNTMKKVRSRNESEDEERPRPLSAAV